ncbi:MAG: GxxExxY protein [Planctomycetales bacterium]|nr:GxxExxY protein [Planctomycetales bacterium]
MNRYDAKPQSESQKVFGMREPSPEVNLLAEQVVDASFEVHKTLGAGFLESTYEKALSIELNIRNIPHEVQKPVCLSYKGNPVGEARLDLLVSGLLVVELKAVDSIHPIHQAQVINYLKATGCELGLLINFNVTLLKDGLKRIVLTY